MAVKYLAGDRLIGTAAERAALSGNTLGSIAQTSWKELDRITLGSSSAEVEVTGLTAKDNLMILVYSIGSNTNDAFISFNGDEGSNYANRYARNGGNESNDPSQSIGLRYEQGATTPQFAVITVRNIASKEKLVIGHTVTQNSTGANSPTRQEWTGKWANTSNAITQVTLDRASGTFDSGTELIVLGCDDDEADSGTNFWQELSNTDLSAGASDNINSGTITAKKWLMVDCHIVPATYNHGNSNIIVNSDTAQANYSMRRNYDGGNESNETYAGSNPSGSSNGMYTGFGENRSSLSMHTMIANVSGKEKLMMWHMNIAIAGAGNTGDRVESVGKWHTTSGQITNFKIYTGANGNAFGTTTRMRVWGAD